MRARSAARLAARNSIAILAIVVAVAGTATASHLVVRAADIQKDAVRAKHIKPKTVGIRQLKAPSLARRFGSSVLGGQVVGLTIPAGLSGDEARAPIGVSASPDEAFDIVAPRRMVLRDLTVDAEAPVVRRIALRLRAKPNIGFLSCTIEIGERRCNSGSERLAVPRGSRVDVWVGDLGPGDVNLTDNGYRFAFRTVP